MVLLKKRKLDSDIILCVECKKLPKCDWKEIRKTASKIHELNGKLQGWIVGCNIGESGGKW